MVVVDVTTLKMAGRPVKLQRKIQQDALGKVNRVKEISRRDKNGLKLTDNKHYVRKKECYRYLRIKVNDNGRQVSNHGGE